jgi:hypothetical protein
MELWFAALARPTAAVPSAAAKLIQELIDQMSGLLDHAPLETRVAWVRDLFERIDVDGVEQRAVARWKAPTDQDVDRLESVTEWLRRAGAGHLLRSRGETPI